MDRIYRRQRYFYDLTRKYYLVGRDRLIRDLDLRPGSSAVEVGCGTARNLIAIAGHYPGTRLFGLDVSLTMLETARRAVEHAGLSDRILLVHGYAEALVPELFGEKLPFDCAIFSYSLSMIPDWCSALEVANRALVPGGRLHMVDFGDFSGLGRFGALALRRWLRMFHVEPRTELLYALEGAIAGGLVGDLWVSPRRYAFAWSVPRCSTRAFANVAGQPQAAGNP